MGLFLCFHLWKILRILREKALLVWLIVKLAVRKVFYNKTFTPPD
ncbi:hypothetical protein EDB95_0478 [Dinghuibacter silviterrae]|uniref:Uncharacterized protein n=1 Tax=Dinghuibacter silviterrae TaxID=1539049 RepID=A0A4R8DNS7_9BACT|nr:hypothetical protein EDB95_0478 [Dinghuibacter silviterrae]